VTASFRTDADRDRFEAAANQWAAAMPTASARRDGTNVALRSCDPGTGYKAPSPKPTPFDTLTIRDEFAQGLMQSAAGVELRVATCATDRLIAQLGPEAFDRLNQAEPDETVLAALQAAAPVAGARCRANADDRA
jgi:hypothetical protein